MYGLAVGISQVGTTLPVPVYALLSGLNAATVGIIALAGVRLAMRAISDRITRFWVYLGGFMGMLYSSLWSVPLLQVSELGLIRHRYYPAILAGAGITTLLFDFRYPHQFWGHCKRKILRIRTEKPNKKNDVEAQASFPKADSPNLEKPLPALPRDTWSEKTFRYDKKSDMSTSSRLSTTSSLSHMNSSLYKLSKDSIKGIPSMSWQLGTSIIALFALTFILVIALSHMLRPNRILSVFSALYEAGTIIVGGGPVVIPLLQSYLVTPGWVEPRDFLLGLAIIQAFPGPNFNFAIYLGALAVKGTSCPSYLGALIAFIGMYGPGIFIMIGFMGLWRLVQGRKWFEAVLRGVNAAAVGLVFTAVWKLWEIGWLKPGQNTGSPLGGDPWLVGISGTAYVGNAWFGLNPPMAILLGGALGVGRWAALSPH